MSQFGTLWDSHVSFRTLSGNLEPVGAPTAGSKSHQQSAPHGLEPHHRTMARLLWREAQASRPITALQTPTEFYRTFEAERVRTELERLEARLYDRRSSLGREFDAVTAVLTELGHISEDEWRLTEAGELAHKPQPNLRHEPIPEYADDEGADPWANLTGNAEPWEMEHPNSATTVNKEPVPRPAESGTKPGKKILV